VLAVAAVLSAVVVFGLVPFTDAAPVVGIVLTLGAPPDHVGPVRAVARRPRNAVLGLA
jgi:hypothetical protein